MSAVDDNLRVVRAMNLAKQATTPQPPSRQRPQSTGSTAPYRVVHVSPDIVHEHTSGQSPRRVRDKA